MTTLQEEFQTAIYNSQLEVVNRCIEEGVDINVAELSASSNISSNVSS